MRKILALAGMTAIAAAVLTAPAASASSCLSPSGPWPTVEVCIENPFEPVAK